MASISSKLINLLAVTGSFIIPSFAAPTAPTCTDRLSHDTTYQGYQITCGVDYWGGDIGGSWQPSFAACIANCDTTATCIDVSYVGGDDGGQCYLKNTVGAEPSVANHVWTAKKLLGAPVATLSCVDSRSNGETYTASNGKTFKVICGSEYFGGDLAYEHTNSFEGCLDVCSTTAGCIDVSYVDGNCYMKNTLTTLVSAGHVWTGKYEPSTSGASSTTAPSSVETAAPLSCHDNVSNNREYGSPTGGLYKILCGIDYAGGDLKDVEVTSFEACITECDKQLGCVDVSYVAPHCYIKTELHDAVEVGHVWSAKVLRAARDIFAFPTATPQNVGTGTEEEFGGPIVESEPVATLGPQTPPGLDTGGLGVVTPDPITTLWYSGGEVAEGEDPPVTVQLSVTYRYPSIVLEHSSHIQGVACAGETALTGRFDDLITYLHATTQWSPNEPTILITNAVSCALIPGQNIFFVAQSITFNDATQGFSATGQIVELAEIMEELDADFGQVLDHSDPNAASPSCGTPSQATLNGLPAVACGVDFDETLDNQLGYYSSEEETAEEVLALASPGVVRERGLALRFIEKRCSWWDLGCKARQAWEWAQRQARELAERIAAEARRIAAEVARRAAEIARQAAEAARRAAEAVAAAARAAVEAARRAAEAAAAILLRGEFSQSLTIPVNLGPPQIALTDSPWGPALKMYTFKRGEDDEKFSLEATMLDNIAGELIGEADPEPGIEIYCHRCAVQGRITAMGSIKATILNGLTRGSIGVKGNMYAGAFIGVNGFAQWEKTIKKPLFVRNLAGWEIPGIISLGPRLILEAMATVSVEATGQIYTGASLSWPAFEATLDFVDRRRSTKSGWTPVVEKAFEVHGEIEAKAALGLPVTLNFGISILNGLWEKGVNLTDTPALTASAEFEATYNPDDGGVSVGNDECEGVAWEIALTNEVTLEIDEFASFTLHEWASPALASGCIGRTREPEEEEPEEPEEPQTTEPPTPSPTPTPTPEPEPPVVNPVGTDPACSGSGSWWQIMNPILWRYYQDGNTRYFTHCNTDFPGADIHWYNAPSWAACIRTCSEWGPSCAGVSWVPSRNWPNCYLKSAMQNQRPDSWVGIPIYSSIKIGVATKRDVPTIEASSPVDAPVPAWRGRFAKRQADPNALNELLNNGTTYSNTTTPSNTTISDTPTNSTQLSNSTATSDTVQIVDSTNVLQLQASLKGNLFVTVVGDTTDLTNTTGLVSFVATNSSPRTVWGDNGGRWLHYYPEALESSGVSRLRLADWEHLPKGSRLVTLVPFTTATGSSMLVSVDSEGEYAWPFMCGIKDELNKVFLVRDVNTAAAKLSELDSKYTITGGQANNCVPLALVFAS